MGHTAKLLTPKQRTILTIFLAVVFPLLVVAVGETGYVGSLNALTILHAYGWVLIALAIFLLMRWAVHKHRPVLLAPLYFALVIIGVAAIPIQYTSFTPQCSGSNDTSAFSSIISTIGSSTGSIKIPWIGTRCAVSNLTVPSNIALDFTNTTGLKVNTGQTLTLRGDMVGPEGQQRFYNATVGLGTVSFSGNGHLSKVFPQWWGAVGDGATNDRAPINAALAGVFTAGGGEVFLPKPTVAYYVTGTIDATCGGLICPPQNSWTGGLNQTMIPISLIGETKGTWGDYGVRGGGTIISSDATYSGPILVPAIISAKVFSSGIAETDFNIIDFHAENLIVRGRDNPSVGGINFMMARRGSVRNVVADVGVTETVGSSTAASNPVNTVYGIAMPKTPNNGQSTIENSVATGYRFGFYGGDHTRYVGFNMAARCLYGFVFENATGMATGDLYDYRNTHGLFFLGTKNIVHINIQSEVDNTSGTWTQRTIGTTVDYQDDADITHGSINFFLETPDGLHTNYAPKVTGLSSVDKTSTYNGKNTTFTHIFDITSSAVLRNPSHEVQGSKVLSGATATITIPAGLTFTSDETYQCNVDDVTDGSKAWAVKVSGSSFTLHGTDTHILVYRCAGG